MKPCSENEKREPGANEGAEANEGEGSRTADREYREGVQRTVRRGHAEEDADQARRDVEADPGTYRRAEEEGKRRSAGEAPGDLKEK